MRLTKPVFLLFVALASIAMACQELFPDTPEDSQTLDGPVDGLNPQQLAAFNAGDLAFNGQVFTSLTGLGPIFVSTSCGSCHAGDGKGHPFTTLTRFGQMDDTGNNYMGQGGPQLQQRAIPGFEPEAVPAGATFAKFLPPANTGLGFLEAVPENDLLSLSDPFDANGDGISGEINWVSLPDFITPTAGNTTSNGKYIGRFGKKAATFNLLHQTVNAYIQDMGITTDYHPEELYHGVYGIVVNDNVPDPELRKSTVDQVVQYLKTLKAPVSRNQDDQTVLEGKMIFMQTGCEKCHKQSLTTGYSEIQALSNKEFHPYTDLLLHDMGPALDDQYTEGNAKTYEWRTPPLWGLGLSTYSQGGKYYLLHDGRATSIESAITMHGGEAQTSRDNFNALSVEEKQKLIIFLESL